MLQLTLWPSTMYKSHLETTVSQSVSIFMMETSGTLEIARRRVKLKGRYFAKNVPEGIDSAIAKFLEFLI